MAVVTGERKAQEASPLQKASLLFLAEKSAATEMLKGSHDVSQRGRLIMP